MRSIIAMPWNKHEKSKHMLDPVKLSPTFFPCIFRDFNSFFFTLQNSDWSKRIVFFFCLWKLAERVKFDLN